MSTEIAVQDQNENLTTISKNHKSARWTKEQIEFADLDRHDLELPSLSSAEAHQAPLAVSYWSPVEIGERKRGYIFGISDAEIIDMETKEPKQSECVFLLEQTENGRLLRWYSASKVLVGNIKSAINRGEIMPGTALTPIEIIYKGLKRTKGGKNAANWEILRLIVSEQ